MRRQRRRCSCLMDFGVCSKMASRISESLVPLFFSLDYEVGQILDSKTKRRSFEVLKASVQLPLCPIYNNKYEIEHLENTGKYCNIWETNALNADIP